MITIIIICYCSISCCSSSSNSSASNCLWLFFFVVVVVVVCMFCLCRLYDLINKIKKKEENNQNINEKITLDFIYLFNFF